MFERAVRLRSMVRLLSDEELATYLDRVEAAGLVCSVPLVGEYRRVVREEMRARVDGRPVEPVPGERGEAIVDLLACGREGERCIRWRAYVTICLGGAVWSERVVAEGSVGEMLIWGHKKAEQMRSWLALHLWLFRRTAPRGVPNCPRSRFNPHGSRG